MQLPRAGDGSTLEQVGVRAGMVCAADIHRVLEAASAHTLRPGRAAAFQVADRPDADPGARGQLLLGQTGVQAVTAQHGAETPVISRHVLTVGTAVDARRAVPGPCRGSDPIKVG